MLALKWADEERNRLLWSCIHNYIIHLSKTHKLVLAMMYADEGRNRLLLCLHNSIHTQFNKTHQLMLAMKWVDAWRENRVLWSCVHNNSVNIDSHSDVGNEVSRYMRRENRLLWSYMQFSKTHHLMLAMKWADEERNRLLYASIHTQFSKLTFWCWQWSEQMRRENRLLWLAGITIQ